MSRGSYKSRLEGLEDNTFNVGASRDPAKFSKLLKNIETYNQKNYKSPDDIAKALQQMGQPTLDYLAMPSKKTTRTRMATRIQLHLRWRSLHGRRTTR
jgi:hypothetical protein